MRLSFIPKDDSNRYKHSSVDSLHEFLMRNTIYLGVSLSILDDWKKCIDEGQVEDIVKNNSRFDDDLMKDENYKEFIANLKEFYNCDDNEISDRRGRLLEILWDKLGTYNNRRFDKKVEEAHILDNNIKISERDIDFVYVNKDKEKISNQFIELHECKASAKSTLREPLKDKHKEKLELMKMAQSISESESILCDALLITFSPNSRYYDRILAKYNFRDIKVICRKEIETIINGKRPYM